MMRRVFPFAEENEIKLGRDDNGKEKENQTFTKKVDPHLMRPVVGTKRGIK